MIRFTERYFDHDADIGIIGYGNTLEEAFEDGASTMFAIMTDIKTLKTDLSISFEFDENDIELAFVTWLNLLIGEARSRGLVLGKFKIQKKGDHWQGQAWGEPWREGLIHGTEVKGATLTMLSVKKNDGRWEARCIVDV